ncbi:hypothetical protein [Arthrobacter sp.]|uniref:hypothetical protein n=1 Tax=Arthrobacter sp. TaxID=1667 RepID=UPI003A95B8B3
MALSVIVLARPFGVAYMRSGPSSRVFNLMSHAKERFTWNEEFNSLSSGRYRAAAAHMVAADRDGLGDQVSVQECGLVELVRPRHVPSSGSEGFSEGQRHSTGAILAS